MDNESPHAAGLESNGRVVVERPFGPHHSAKCLGSLQASKTSSRGASNTRSKTSSGSDAGAGVELGLSPGTMLLLRGLQLLHVGAQTIETFVPQARENA